MYLIAELGTNHGGSIATAVQLALFATHSGVDAIKMQLFEADTLVSRKAETVAHAKGSHKTQYERMKSLELPDEAYEEVAHICYTAKKDFIISPFSVDLAHKASKWTSNLKVASGELTNAPLLKTVKEVGEWRIMSTGMADHKEINTAVEILQPQVLMHCVSLYPTLPWQANLMAIPGLKESFPKLQIGYSDHTVGDLACIAATALGAECLEKHFVLQSDKASADRVVSVTQRSMRKLSVKVRKTEDMIKPAEMADIRMRRHLRRGYDGLRGSTGI